MISLMIRYWIVGIIEGFIFIKLFALVAFLGIIFSFLMLEGFLIRFKIYTALVKTVIWIGFKMMMRIEKLIDLALFVDSLNK
jgi:hypothetical protein